MDNNQPGNLPEAKNEIVVYQPDETIRLAVRLEHETVWLTQLKIAELFGVQKAAISKHLGNIFTTGELIRDATVSKMETVQVEGTRTVVRTNESFHDRFLIIDDKELYLVGASLKDLGRKCFALMKLDPGEIPRIKKTAFAAP